MTEMMDKKICDKKCISEPTRFTVLSGRHVFPRHGSLHYSISWYLFQCIQVFIILSLKLEFCFGLDFALIGDNLSHIFDIIPLLPALMTIIQLLTNEALDMM